LIFAFARIFITPLGFERTRLRCSILQFRHFYLPFGMIRVGKFGHFAEHLLFIVTSIHLIVFARQDNAPSTAELMGMMTFMAPLKQ